jgi:hypothetical protein
MTGAFRRGAALLAVSAATALGVAAPASAAMTVSVPATADLSAKLLVKVPVTVTCGPMDVTGSSLQVQLSEAVKKDIAHGSAFLGGMFGGLQFTCDGAPHPYPVTIVADPSGAPFKRGNAVITATAFVFGTTSDQGSVGPQVIALR